MASEVINGIEVGDPVLTPPVLMRTLRSMTQRLPPDPAALPDGTIMKVVSGVWTMVAPLEAPTDLAVDSQTASAITLTWTVGDPTVNVELYDGDTLIATLDPGTATKQVTGLNANEAHVFKVRHRDGQLASLFTDPLTAYTLPAVPSAPTVSTRDDVSITLALGPVPADQEFDVLQDAVVIATIPATTATYQATGLDPNIEYAFTLIARGATSDLESAASTALDAYTKPATPSAPTSPSHDDTTVDLAFANADADQKTRVYKNAVLLTTLNPGVTTYQATGLTPETLYTFTLAYEGATSTLVGAQSTGLDVTTDAAP